jgi:hypothetical protein
MALSAPPTRAATSGGCMRHPRRQRRTPTSGRLRREQGPERHARTSRRQATVRRRSAARGSRPERTPQTLFMLRLGQSHLGADGGRSDARRGVVSESDNPRQRILQSVTSDHLQRHLAHPPGVVVKAGLHGREGFVLPRPEQAAQRPDPQPVGRPRRLAGDHPASRGSTESQDQLGVHVAASEESDATCHDLVAAPTRTFPFDAFAGCLAPGRRTGHQVRLGRSLPATAGRAIARTPA